MGVVHRAHTRWRRVFGPTEAAPLQVNHDIAYLSRDVGAIPTYDLDLALDLGFFKFPESARSPLTPYYFSVVTYTRLGSGGVTPTHWVGEVVLVCERILGYVTLGMLLSILANKVARRS